MNFESRLQELSSIDWSAIGSVKSEENCADAKMFLQKAACFFKVHGLEGHPPFFNVAEVLGVEERVPEVSQTVEIIVTNAGVPLARRIAAFYLLTEDAAVDGASEIYSPLISVFRRGGMIDFHHGELIVDDEWSIPLNGWIGRFNAAP